MDYTKVHGLTLKGTIECYDLMDQTGLLRLKQAFEHDLAQSLTCCTEQSVNFASIRIQLIDLILEEREEKFKAEQALLRKEG